MTTIDRRLYNELFPEKAQALREASELQRKLITSIKRFNETFFKTDIFGDPIIEEAAKPTHIGTITKFGRYYSAKVLANHGSEVIPVCSRETEEEAFALSEGKYAVERVLGNRFNQEVACI